MEIIILEMLVLVIISNINNTMVVPFATDQDTFNIYMSDTKIVTGSIKPLSLCTKEIIIRLNCFKCGNKMYKIQSCHLRCNCCGAEMDCSDKGYVW